jgi:hypothetical protein
VRMTDMPVKTERAATRFCYRDSNRGCHESCVAYRVQGDHARADPYERCWDLFFHYCLSKGLEEIEGSIRR